MRISHSSWNPSFITLVPCNLEERVSIVSPVDSSSQRLEKGTISSGEIRYFCSCFGHWCIIAVHGYRLKSTWEIWIVLIFKTIVLQRMDARSIRGKPFCPMMTSGPTGIIGWKDFLVLRLNLARKPKTSHTSSSPHHQRIKGNPAKRDGEVSTHCCYPPLRCTMMQLLHHNIDRKCLLIICLFYFTTKIGIISAPYIDPVWSHPKASQPPHVYYLAGKTEPRWRTYGWTRRTYSRLIGLIAWPLKSSCLISRKNWARWTRCLPIHKASFLVISVLVPRNCDCRKLDCS
jgi:hypothetical protein